MADEPKIDQPQTVKARDSCVVRTGPLGAMVDEFVTRWNRDHDRATGRRFATPGAAPLVAAGSPFDHLAAETGRHGPTVPPETIRTVWRRKNATTELRVADAIVTALGHPEAFHNGTLEVLPNPHATAQARAACCGSSSLLGA